MAALDEWMASAAARISFDWIRPAWPRYAAAPRFSTVAAVSSTIFSPPSSTESKFVFGRFGFPPSCLTVPVRASTCSCSLSRIIFAVSASALSLITPESMTAL